MDARFGRRLVRRSEDDDGPVLEGRARLEELGLQEVPCPSEQQTVQRVAKGEVNEKADEAHPLATEGLGLAQAAE